MDELIKQAGQTILSLGFPGVILLASGYMNHRLFELYREVQELRIKEARELMTVVDENARETRILNDLIRQRKD